MIRFGAVVPTDSPTRAGEPVRARVSGLGRAAHRTVVAPLTGPEGTGGQRVAVVVLADRFHVSLHLSTADGERSWLVASRALPPAAEHDVAVVPGRAHVRVTVDDDSVSFPSRAVPRGRAPAGPSRFRLAARPPRRRPGRSRGGRRTVAVSALGVVLALLSLSTAGASDRVPGSIPPGEERSAFTPSFRGRGLVTNERAYWDHNPRRRSSDWEMTSGSLFAQDGVAWTGYPDDLSPDTESAWHTNSSVFRLVSKRSGFRNVGLSVAVKLQGYVSSPGSPRHDYDGVHLWLRYRSEQSLYTVDVGRRDGQITIKRKTPGGPVNGGSYVELGRSRRPLPVGSWVQVRATAVNLPDGRVRIILGIGGRRVLTVIDSHPGALRTPGRVGVRGDNAQFQFTNFVAVPR